MTDPDISFSGWQCVPSHAELTAELWKGHCKANLALRSLANLFASRGWLCGLGIPPFPETASGQDSLVESLIMKLRRVGRTKGSDSSEMGKLETGFVLKERKIY